jgi:hypothetical protein
MRSGSKSRTLPSCTARPEDFPWGLGVSGSSGATFGVVHPKTTAPPRSSHTIAARTCVRTYVHAAITYCIPRWSPWAITLLSGQSRRVARDAPPLPPPTSHCSTRRVNQACSDPSAQKPRPRPASCLRAHQRRRAPYGTRRIQHAAGLGFFTPTCVRAGSPHLDGRRRRSRARGAARPEVAVLASRESTERDRATYSWGALGRCLADRGSVSRGCSEQTANDSSSAFRWQATDPLPDSPGFSAGSALKVISPSSRKGQSDHKDLFGRTVGRRRRARCWRSRGKG